MTPITLDHLPPQLTQRLQQRATQNGRTIEAEITVILSNALIQEPPPTEALGLATAIQRHFIDIEDFEIPEIPREPIRTPPTFF